MTSLKHFPLAFHRLGKCDPGSSLARGRASTYVGSSWFVSRLLRALALAGLLFVVLAPDAFAASSIGQNVGGLLKGYAGELYGGIVATCSLIFLWNRRYIELATFLFASVVVAWMVFVPEQIGKAAETIGHQIFA